MCRDHNKDQKHIRKLKKSEFKEMLKDEMDKEDKVMDETDEND